MREGRHPALITWDTYSRIQERLDGGRTFARADVREEFALRGIVACAGCGKPLTASWSRGRHKRYPYYHCAGRGCGLYGKTLAKERLETGFAEMLGGLETSDEAMEIIGGIVEDFWRQRGAQSEQRRDAARLVLRKAEAELEALTDRLAQTESAAVARALERGIERAESRRARLALEAAQGVEEMIDAGTAFRRARGALKSPLQTWQLEDLAGRRLVARRVFAAPPRYDRERGFGTADLSLPYLVSRAVERSVSRLVDPQGNNSNVTDILGKINWEEFARLISAWAAPPSG